MVVAVVVAVVGGACLCVWALHARDGGSEEKRQSKQERQRLTE